MSSFIGIAGDLHATLPTSRQDGDPLPALGLELAERLDRQLLGLKTEHKAGARTSGKPPLLNPDVFKHVNTEDSAIVAKLVYLLQERVSYQRLLACRGTDAQTLLDLLQDLLDLDSFPFSKSLILKALLRLSRESGLHPRCFVLPELHKVGNQVALEALGIFGRAWSVKNLAEKLSFGANWLTQMLCLVSPWMENGNIMKFLEINKPATQLNILVTPSGKACIADFGVSSITHAMTLLFTTSTANGRGGTARYQAPELFQGGQNHFGSDVYAFACVCYEDTAVMFAVIEGKRPLQPMSCTGTTVLDSLWELLNNCWEGRAEMRPTAPQIVERLEDPSIQAKTMSSTTDWDNQFTSRFRRSLQSTDLLLSLTRIEHTLFGKETVQGRNFTTELRRTN
ncbi:kinase-like domain-containing protein [Mycena leptocephala]|nr:kinase-like domain-containing protein [Mycena leptocephala]